jgi:hypothetical protein
MLRGVVWIMAFVLAGLTMADNIHASGKTSVVKGTVYIGDKSHPLSGALILLLDEKKTSSSDHSVDTKADENGYYKFADVAEGQYTVSIRTWYGRQEDAPCKLLMAKTKDKDSTVMVARDQGKYVEQIFIKGFSVKGGKDIDRNFDIECKSMLGG